jgi:hypothetical protein
MRIRCFSEARGVFEEGQISFEPQMYCFGGGGGAGGAGGDSRASMDSMDDDPDTGDFGVDTGSGQRGGNDNSGVDQAIAEQEAYDAAGGSPSQNFSSGRGGGGGGNSDTDSAITQQDYNNLQGGRSVIEQILAERAGAFPGPSPGMTQDDVYNLFGDPSPVDGGVDDFNTGAFGTSPVDGGVDDFNTGAYGTSPVDGGVDDFNTGAYGTRADLGITPNPIESQISIANALKNLGLQAEEEKLFSPVNIPGFIGAGINLIGGAANAAQKYGGGNIPGYAQDVMNRPGGAPIMANAPMMSPAQPSAFLEALMAGSDRQPVGPYSEAEGVPDVLGGFGPNQLSFLPGEPDNIYVGDPRGIEQAQMLDPNVQVLDENYFSQGQELSDRGSDQAAPPALTLPDPVTQECPEGYTRDGSGVCVYEGRAMALKPFSASRGPRNFQYTGVGSLQPFILQPTPVRQADPVDPFARMRS